MTHRIEHERTYDAPPSAVYAVLTSGERFAAMTGAPASIDAKAGEPFSCFGGAIGGRNVECVDGTRLVQAWRVDGWDEGRYSLVRFELSAEGEGTKLSLEHTGFPEDQAEHLAQGWVERYLEPLAKAVAD